MSELIQKNDNRTTIRRKLLTGASVLALTVYGTSANVAKAENAGHPTIWFEVDSQFARQDASDEGFLAPFLLASQFDGASQINRRPQSIWDDGAKISFQPEESDWVLSASIRFGKASWHKAQNQLTAHPTATYGGNYNAYQNFTAQSSESHTILNFQVGKDVGLGKFGNGGHSLLGLGVRYAQFNSKSNVSIHSQPTNANYFYHRFYANFDEQRKFTGIGPSVSWDASANIAGNGQDGSISLDWGVNGAILFGQQRARGHHQLTDEHTIFVYPHHQERYSSYQASASPSRSKTVTVPNLGVFAGLSWRASNTKVSLGYRADMFFGAIDGGIDARKSENRGFYGPFASISVGVGD